MDMLAPELCIGCHVVLSVCCFIGFVINSKEFVVAAVKELLRLVYICQGYHRDKTVQCGHVVVWTRRGCMQYTE